MAAELRERIARVIWPAAFDRRENGEYLYGTYQSREDALAKASAILALLPQPSPGEYGGLIEEAREVLAEAADTLRVAHDDLFESAGRATLLSEDVARLDRLASCTRRLADALSSALRERDMIAAVNADWSAYDKGVREAGKALVASALASPVNRISADMQQFWDAVQALRSALSLVPESKDNGS